MSAPLRQVAVLFCRADSIYKTMPGCDVWDAERDALKWPGGCPVVAHPPCGPWGRLRQFCNADEGTTNLAPWAIGQIRQQGGGIGAPSGFAPLQAHSLLSERISRSLGWVLPIGSAVVVGSPGAEMEPYLRVRLPSRRHSADPVQNRRSWEGRPLLAGRVAQPQDDPDHET